MNAIKERILEIDTDQYDQGSFAIRLNDEHYEESQDLLAEAQIKPDAESSQQLFGYHPEYLIYSEKLAEAIHNVIYDNEEVQQKIAAEFKKLMEEES